MKFNLRKVAIDIGVPSECLKNTELSVCCSALLLKVENLV